MGVNVAAFSDVKKQGSERDSEDGYTYCWSGRSHGQFEGVAVAVADRLVPMDTEVTHVNERIVRLRFTHTLDYI